VFFGAVSRRSKADSGAFEKRDSRADSTALEPAF
jgi:hypothetical protein